MNLHELVDCLMPHIYNLNIEFRKQILDIFTSVPLDKTSPNQFLNLIQILHIKGDY